MKFRPALDIHDGKIKQIVGSTLEKNLRENFVATDNFAAAEIFFEKKLRGGHVILLDQKKNSRILAEKILRKFPNFWQIGGGVNLENGKFWLDCGAEKLIFSSILFSEKKINFPILEKLKKNFGAKKIVFDLSARQKNGEFFVAIDRWQTLTNFKISVENLKILANFCDEFLVHAVDVEGKKCGIDKKLLAILKNFSDQKIVFAGGIADKNDIEKIKIAGQKKIDFTVGSALEIFGGNLSLEKILKN